MLNKLKKISSYQKILIMLAFFSISLGLWNNFRELWLQNNNLNITDISSILSISTFIAAFIILIVSIKINLKKIKNFITVIMILKLVSMLFLYFLDGNLYLKSYIFFFIILDNVFEKIIITSIYPLIVTIKKDDEIYAKRKLVEYLFRDIGILIGGLLIGKVLFNYLVDYNACLFISLIFLAIAIFLIINLKAKSNSIHSKISFKEIFADKMNLLYFGYGISANIAMKTALGLKMLILVNKMNFTPAFATNYFLLIGLLADFIGIIILKFLTSKNDYLTLFFKFGIRAIFYFIAFVSNNLYVIFLAMTWSLLISTSYENITEAPNINRIKNEYQLFFNGIRYVIWLIGESIGLYLSGIAYNFGLRYVFLISAVFIIVQIMFQILLVNKRKRYYS